MDTYLLHGYLNSETLHLIIGSTPHFCGIDNSMVQQSECIQGITILLHYTNIGEKPRTGFEGQQPKSRKVTHGYEINKIPTKFQHSAMLDKNGFAALCYRVDVLNDA